MVCAALFLTADRSTAQPSLYANPFIEQIEHYPQEKLHVSTDKDSYIAGDTIWLRAHCADAATHRPIAASRYVYVELRDDRGALVRRSKVYAPALLTVGKTTLDGDQYMLIASSDTVRLFNMEYLRTELFFRHPRQVFSSAHLFEKIWGLDSQAEMDVVWTYICFLRRKRNQSGADVEIRTIRGAGYALEEMPC